MTNTPRKRVVIIEDDASLNALLVDQISFFGMDANGVAGRAEARELFASVAPDLMIVDMRLPDCDGFDLLEEFGHLCPVIILTAYGTVDQALKAVQSGAADYLFKPVSPESLELAVTRAFATIELKRDVLHWQTQAQRAMNETFVGDSPEVQKIRGLVELYADAGSTVLIEGESGVGKELVARAIHQASRRANARFVPIDCDPAEEILTSAELFGQEKGAFAAANVRREGMLELAAGGTIFISDIAEVSLALQSKLLRVMETGIYRRLGGTQDLVADVHIVAGTSRDLNALVQEGTFRSELFYRLNAFCIHVPPLRERRGDIRALASHFVATRGFQRGAEKTLSQAALEALEQSEWSGNVRELRNAVERGMILSGQDPVIGPQHIMGASPAQQGGSALTLSFPDEPTAEHLRDAYLSLLLERYGGNRQRVASVLGISERNTYRLISKLPGGD